MYQTLEETREKFFHNCQLCARAPGSYFWSGEHAVMYGQLAVVHAIPLYAYVGIEFTEGKGFEFEVRGINKKADTIRIEKLTTEQVEPIQQWYEEDRIKKYLEFWRVTNKQNYFKVKVWFEVPPKCGLNSSGAIGAALAGLLHVLEVGKSRYEELIGRINTWKHKPVEELKADPIFKDIFLKAWILDDCSHNFSSSGTGPFPSLVGSPDGNLLLYFTQKKGFDSRHPIKRITKSNEELKFNDFEDIGRKIVKIDWWGKKLTLKKNLKESLGTVLIYCGTPKDTGDILAELNKRYNIPIEDFKSFFSTLFSERTLKEFTEMARPISDFVRDYSESPPGTDFYVKSTFCESLGLLSWMLVRLINLYQDDQEQLYAHTESINKLLDFYGVFGEQQAELYNQIKEINPNVGVKMTGAGGGGDLVVFGHRDLTDGLENHIGGKYAIHFSTNHNGWQADGLTITQTFQKKVAPALIHNIPESHSKTLGVKDRYFELWTEKGHAFGNEAEYREKYANPPESGELLVWVNLITRQFFVCVRGRQQQAKLSGQKKELLCMLLKNFNKAIPIKEMANLTPDYAQVLHQLHKATFNILAAFLDGEPGESRTLRAFSKYKRNRKFTFCLIEPYQKSEKQNEVKGK